MLWLTLCLSAAAKPAPLPPPPLEETAARLIGAALASPRAWEQLEVLCDDIGHRLAGSAALDRAVAWGLDAMRSDGLQARTEPVSVPVWVRGAESGAIVSPSPTPLHLLALGRSVPTPPGGLQAEVVVVSSFDALAALGESQIRGKIVVYDVPFTTYGETVRYRWSGASEAAKYGAVAVLVRSVTPESLQSPHTGSMGYAEGVTPIPAAAISVEDALTLRRLAARGPVTVRLSLESRVAPDAPSANVIGEVRGRSAPDEVVVVGCHLDSWDVGQGAQDDGAGCVMAMAAGRLIAALPVPPRRTVRVVLFTNEESGLAGGRAYAAAHGNERHVALLEADTGAGAPLGWRVEPGGSDDDLRAALAPLAPLADLLAPLGAGSLEAAGSGADIGPTVALGFPGLGLMNDMAPYWRIHHTEADTLDKIDPMLLRRNVAVVAATTWWWAEIETPPVLAP
jgi:carboxypeptidase Q